MYTTAATARVLPFSRPKTTDLAIVRHSSAGTSKTVYPIKDPAQREAISNYLLGDGKKYTQRRNWMIFNFGIRVGLRAGDLVRLTVRDVMNPDGSIKNYMNLREHKTGKLREIFYGQKVRELLADYISQENLHGDDFLFGSQKKNVTRAGCMSVSSLGEILSAAAKAVGITDAVSTHSLRKTFGYDVYSLAKKSSCEEDALTMLMYIFGHSSRQITLRYIGVTRDCIQEIYHLVDSL